MIAMLVFMVIMLGVAGGLIATIKTNRGTVVRDEALRLAEDELNRLKSERFSASGTSGDLTATAPPTWTAPTPVLSNLRSGALPFARARQITDLATAATALKRIDVVVGWNELNSGAPPPVSPANPTGTQYRITLSTIIVRSD